MATPAGKFNKESYNKNNSYGIQLFVKHLESLGHTILKDDSTEDYGVDIKSIRDGKEFHFEIEMSNRQTFTSSADYPFGNVSFLARKKKMCESGTHFEYVVICNNTNHFYSMNSSAIFQPQYFQSQTISTPDRQGYDEFYRVPKNLAYFNKLNLDE